MKKLTLALLLFPLFGFSQSIFTDSGSFANDTDFWDINVLQVQDEFFIFYDDVDDCRARLFTRVQITEDYVFKVEWNVQDGGQCNNLVFRASGNVMIELTGQGSQEVRVSEFKDLCNDLPLWFDIEGGAEDAFIKMTYTTQSFACTIPTASEWGLLSLFLTIMIVGSVSLKPQMQEIPQYI